MNLFEKSFIAGIAVVTLATAVTADAKSRRINNHDPQFGQACFNRCINTGRHSHNFCERRCQVSMPQQSLHKQNGAARLFRQ